MDPTEDAPLLPNKLSRFSPITLTWENVNYFVNVRTGPPCIGKSTKKQILYNVSGMVKPGQLLAIIGSTGAGKSTLMDILSNRGKMGTVSGNILINGSPTHLINFKRLSGYVTQDDCLFSTLTVAETFQFYADLKLPSSFTKQEREARVNQIISELRLEKVRDSRIGNQFKRGISGGEKKRVSVGCELITDPGLLFLDEPTTGLDSFNAASVMELLTTQAKKGRTVVCTIHQPRSTIFEMFDQLMILSQGRVVYFGAAQEAVGYFGNMNFICRDVINPADFFMDVVVNNEKLAFKGDESADLYGSWQTSNECNNMMREIQSEPHKVDLSLRSSALGTYSSSWVRQFVYLSQRNFRNTIRSPATTYIQLFQTLFMAFLVGTTFFDLGLSQASIQNRSGVLFFITTNQGFSAFAALNLLIAERDIFKRERGSMTYRSSSYFLSKMVVEIPLSIMYTAVFTLVVYWMIGLQHGADKFGIFILILSVFVTCAGSLFIAIGSVAPNLQVASIFAPLILVLLMLFGGLLVNSDSIPPYFIWIKYISFFNYAFGALMKNEFTGLVFDPDCPSSAPNCTIIYSGTEALQIEGFANVDIWFNIGIMFAIIVVLRVFGLIAITLLHKEKN